MEEKEDRQREDGFGGVVGGRVGVVDKDNGMLEMRRGRRRVAHRRLERTVAGRRRACWPKGPSP